MVELNIACPLSLRSNRAGCNVRRRHIKNNFVQPMSAEYQKKRQSKNGELLLLFYGRKLFNSGKEYG
jgi:hypothetical protein